MPLITKQSLVVNGTRIEGNLPAINWSQLMTSVVFPAAGTNENAPVIIFVAVALVVALATRGRLGYADAIGTDAVMSAGPATAVTPA